jgi:hypothetical protein
VFFNDRRASATNRLLHPAVPGNQHLPCLKYGQLSEQFCSDTAQSTCVPYELERCDFKLKARMPSSECTMNIFYLIGVAVVVIVVAGFLGVHL